MSTRVRFRFWVRTLHTGHAIDLAIAITQHRLQATCLHGATHGAAMDGALHTGHGRWITTGGGVAGTLALAVASTGRPDACAAAACLPPLPLPAHAWLPLLPLAFGCWAC